MKTQKLYDSTDPQAVLDRIVQLHHETQARLEIKSKLEEDQAESDREWDRLEKIAAAMFLVSPDPDMVIPVYSLGWSCCESVAGRRYAVSVTEGVIECRPVGDVDQVLKLTPEEVQQALNPILTPLAPYQSDREQCCNGSGFHLPCSPRVFAGEDQAISCNDKALTSGHWPEQDERYCTPF